MKSILVILIGFLGVAATATAGERIKDPWQAFKLGEGDRVEASWRPAAKAGDVEAQLFLGYFAAMSGRQKEAALWYQMAAAQGDPSAQTLLATKYLTGEGTERDPVKAFAWYDLAADQGYANAGRARDAAGRQMSPHQIEQARALADNWRANGPPGKLDDPNSPSVGATAEQ